MQAKTKQTIAAITGEEVAAKPEPEPPSPSFLGLGMDWEERLNRDMDKHNAGCRVCRNSLEPEDSNLYAVKNKRTREFVHVIADTTEEAIAQLGWPPEDVGYTMGVELHTKKKMTDETKADLKVRNKAKRQETKEANAKIRAEVVDRVSSPCYSGKDQPRKEECDMTTLNEWVKGFMDDHVMVKSNGKMAMDPKALFALAEANRLDVKKYKSKYRPQDAGRIRMTVGNMLRGAAARRHKLLTPGGKSSLVPAKLVTGKPTEDVHGSRIKKSA